MQFAHLMAAGSAMNKGRGALLMVAMLLCLGAGCGKKAPPNNAPRLTNLPARESGLWGRPDAFSATAEDADGLKNTLTWRLAGTDCPFTPAVEASTGEISWICGSVGSCTVDVQVADNGAPSLSENGLLTIDCINSAPTLTETPGTTATEQQVYTYTARCQDSDGDALTISKSADDSCNGQLSDQGSGTGVYTFTPDETQGGWACRVGLKCTDTQATVEEKATVNIMEVNEPPVIGNLPASETGAWGQPDSYGTTATDPDLPANGLTWSLAAHNCPFTPVVTASTGEVSWTCGAVGTCTADVKVTDDGIPGLSDRERLSISCTNRAPKIVQPPGLLASEDVPYAYVISCTDEDGDTLTLDKGAFDTCGGVLAINGNGAGIYTFTPDETQGSSLCVVDVTCSDTQDSDRASSTVSILELNQAPRIGNLPASESGHWGKADSFSALASDDDLPANRLT